MTPSAGQSAIPAADQVLKFISETSFLPPAFEIIPKLLLLLDDPEGNSEALADLIHVDPGLTANVLQISNSAVHAGAARTETLNQAIMRLGLREIYKMVMKIVASPLLTSSHEPALTRLDLWQHSLASAVAAQILATEKGEDAEIAYTSALLHDIGKLVMAHALGSAYVDLVERCKKDGSVLFESERAEFKMDHAQAGGRLLKRWNFPPAVVAAVAHHHSPLAAPKQEARLASTLYLANILAYRIRRGYGFPLYAAQPDPAALRVLDLDAGELSSLQADVSAHFEQEQARLR
jgi:putative nucleotidyltransferase with HDIG domain